MVQASRLSRHRRLEYKQAGFQHAKKKILQHAYRSRMKTGDAGRNEINFDSRCATVNQEPGKEDIKRKTRSQYTKRILVHVCSIRMKTQYAEKTTNFSRRLNAPCWNYRTQLTRQGGCKAKLLDNRIVPEHAFPTQGRQRRLRESICTHNTKR